MLVEGRILSFSLNRLANSKFIAFALPSSNHHHHHLHHRCHHQEEEVGKSQLQPQPHHHSLSSSISTILVNRIIGFNNRYHYKHHQHQNDNVVDGSVGGRNVVDDGDNDISLKCLKKDEKPFLSNVINLNCTTPKIKTKKSSKVPNKSTKQDEIDSSSWLSTSNDRSCSCLIRSECFPIIDFDRQSSIKESIFLTTNPLIRKFCSSLLFLIIFFFFFFFFLVLFFIICKLFILLHLAIIVFCLFIDFWSIIVGTIIVRHHHHHYEDYDNEDYDDHHHQNHHHLLIIIKSFIYFCCCCCHLRICLLSSFKSIVSSSSSSLNDRNLSKTFRINLIHCSRKKIQNSSCQNFFNNLKILSLFRSSISLVKRFFLIVSNLYQSLLLLLLLLVHPHNNNQTTTTITTTRRITKTKQQSKLNLNFRLLFFAMIFISILGGELSRQSLFVVAQSQQESSSSSFSSGDDDSIKHSTTTTTTTTSNPTFNHHHHHDSKNIEPKRKTFELAEKFQNIIEWHMFKIMSIKSRPQPAPHYKVPDYMVDLYQWFKQGSSQRMLSSMDQDDNDEETDNNDDDGDPTTSSSSFNDGKKSIISNSLIGLTTNDLRETNHQNDDGDVIEHHRIPRVKRQSQFSRVTLKGPSSSVIGHRLTSSYLKGHINSRIKRSNDASGRDHSLSLNDENMAQLKFDIHLPQGEFLTGAELRLYRHSTIIEYNNNIYDNNRKTKKPESINDMMINDDDDIEKMTKPLMKKDDDGTIIKNHHNDYVHHWSLRLRHMRNESSNQNQDQSPQSSFFNHIVESIDSHHHHQSASSLQNLSHHHHHHLKSFLSGEKIEMNKQHEKKFLQRINIYHLLKPLSTTTNHDQSSKRLIDTQEIDVQDSGWLSFDVFPAVNWWIKHPNENHGLLVTLTDQMGEQLSPQSSRMMVFEPDDSSKVQSINLDDAEHPWHELQPMVVTFSNTDQIQKSNLMNREKSKLIRSKREPPSQNHHERNKKKPKSGKHRSKNRKTPKGSVHQRKFCRRHLLYLDFKEVGWVDWIVAPPGFQTFYCKGECSFPISNPNTTNHATIQALVNTVNPAVVPEPCCVPTDLAPTTLLYVDQHDKVVLKSYPDMVVEGCGCS